MKISDPCLLQATDQPLRILDLGTGIADFPEIFVSLSRHAPDVTLANRLRVDANPGHQWSNAPPGRLSRRWPPDSAKPCHQSGTVADAPGAAYPSSAFDVVIAYDVLHHFRPCQGGYR